MLDIALVLKSLAVVANRSFLQSGYLGLCLVISIDGEAAPLISGAVLYVSLAELKDGAQPEWRTEPDASITYFPVFLAADQGAMTRAWPPLHIRTADVGIWLECRSDDKTVRSISVVGSQARNISHWPDLILSIGRQLQNGAVDELELIGGVPAVMGRRCRYSADEVGFSIVRRFREQAAARPNAVSVSSAGQQLTYGDLDVQSERVALSLRDRGIALGHRVAIRLERSTDYVISILGVLKAGAAYVPIDDSQPAERAETVLVESACALLISDFGETALWSSKGVLCVTPTQLKKTWHSVEPLPEAGGNDTAYVIFTSGSTGTAKGVVVSHHSCLRLFASLSEHLPIGHDDRFSVCHSFGFDLSVFELWGALLHGGVAVIATSEQILDPSQLADVLTTHQVTVGSFTPSGFQLAKTALIERAADLQLRSVLLGGERLVPRTLGDWFSSPLGSSVQVANLYGITESTVHATWRVIKPSDVAFDASPVGQPLSDLEIKLVDKHDKTVPIGFIGEVWVGGDGVATGYTRSDLSRESFFEAPSCTDGRVTRWYRSGDFGYITSDGELHLIGRKDEQIKLRGYRIELGEIQSALLSCHGVREVVVKFAPAPPVPRILAWVQSDETGAAFAEGIRLQLKTRLPAYMIPSRIYCVPEIPLNINGKVDIDRLDSKEGDVASEGPPQRTETSSPIQTLLREVFEISLGHTDFENSDSFFEFGGDSISVLSLIGLAGKRGLLLKVEDVWKYPSVSLLTQRIDTAGFALAKSLPLSGMIATGRSPIARLPMTELQIGMILETIRSGELAPYHDLFLYTINGYLDPIRFTAAVYSVCARAAVLRSRFDLGAIDGPQQTFSANIDKIVEYLEVDPGALDKVAQIRAEFWMAADLLRGWDYAAGPLFRCAVTLESGTHQARYLCISFHHAILDGWSVSALIGELLRTYDHGSISVEDAPIGSFADYVNLERVALNNESARAFWRNYVQSNAIRHIPLVPISFKPCERQAFADRYPAASVPITTSQIERVNRRATRCRCLPKTIFLAAAALTNSMYSNGERSLFGLVTNGRPPTVSKLGLPDLGLFLNVIPFAVDTRTGTSLDLISRCHEGEVEILPWRLYPYSGMTKDAGQQVVNLVFNYTDFTAYDDASKEASIKITKIEYFERTEFDLLLYVSRDLGTAGWHARVSFNQERFTQQFAENFIQTYVQVLEDLTNPASLRLDEISPWGHICTESNRETKTEKPFFLDDFFAQSRHHWREVAAICDSGKTFTYEELDGRALAIASLLRAKGVGPGDIVPICLPRGGKQVVCILGVLRTGAAFLQLDPSLPAPSRHKLLTRAPFSVLITDGRSAADFQDQLVLVVDRDGLPVDSSSASNVSKYPSQAPQRADTDAAYAVFTSGSTGLPKLVIISHRSICTLVSWHVRAFQDAGTRPTALVATVGFDVSVQEIFVALAWGSMLVTVPDEVRSQPRSLLDFLERNKVARLFFPTALLIQLGVDYESLSNKGLHLKEIFVAGERLRVDAGFRKLFAAMPQCILVNQYGPSETHVVASQTMMGPSEAWPTLPPIGRPIMGSGVFIGDHQGRLLPPESIGQIWITGASVGMGYLSNWEATRSVFSCWNGQRRAFITQDLGFVDVRGLLHCVGRTDECVKHAGYLVSLSNVETAIAALPGIRAVSVVAVGESGSSQKLVAFVVTSDRLARGALRAALCAEHPSYVVPDAFIQVESLPMTGNGKIDKRGLILRAAHASDQRTEFDGDVEKCIAEIWRSRTGVSVMADDVGFFDAGGSSLDAVQVVTLINQRFGIELEFVEFFSLANIKRIAHRVRELSIGATARQEPAQMRRRRERLSGSLKHNSREDRNG